MVPRIEDDEERGSDVLAFVGGDDEDLDESDESEGEESTNHEEEEEEETATNNAGNENDSTPLDPLQTFRVTLKSTVRCDECKMDTVTREPHFTITLCFPSSSLPTSAVYSHNNKSNGHGGGMKGKKKGGKSAGKAARRAAGEEEEEEAYEAAEPAIVATGGAASSEGGELRNLNDYLDRFGKAERLSVERGEGFDCERCAKRGIARTDATKRLEIEATGDVVVFHMNRFQAITLVSGKGNKVRSAKVADAVRLEEEIGLPGGAYRLFGVVEHLGSSMGSGHYVAHVRSSAAASGAWFSCSDSSVSATTLQKVLNAQCYLAFYERVVE